MTRPRSHVIGRLAVGSAFTDGRWMPRTREVPNAALLGAVLAMSGF